MTGTWRAARGAMVVALVLLAASGTAEADSDLDRFQMLFSNHTNRYVRGEVQGRQYLYMSPGQQNAEAHLSVNIVGSPRTHVVQQVNFVHFTAGAPVWCTFHLELLYESNTYRCTPHFISSQDGASCTTEGSHAFTTGGSDPGGGCKFYLHIR